MRKMLGLLVLPFFAGNVAAEGFTTIDLGWTEYEHDCLDISEIVFDEYGAEEISLGNWTVTAFALGYEEGYHAVVTCTGGPDGGITATLVLYSSPDVSDLQRSRMADEYADMWSSWNW